MSQSAVVPIQKQSLVQKFAAKYSIEAPKMLDTLKATAFRQSGGNEITNEQMAALLIVADQYGLNPFTREIYAFPDKGGIVPVVGVDGWSRIINEHPQSDGFEFVESEETTTLAGKTVPKWMEVVIHRKDRAHPIRVREQFAEVVRESMQPWKSHPTRMLRHKTLIQGARIAYGFTGIYDEDEAERIVERDMGTIQPAQVVEMPKAKSEPKAEPVKTAETIDGGTGEIVADQAASESMLKVLKTKMETAALGEADMRAKFGHGYEGVTTVNFNTVTDWIGNPAG